MITIDGGSGKVYLGRIELVPPQLNDDFQTILGWADGYRRLHVRANADTPADAVRAREFGAEGIGLCRTEHMFFGEERLPVMQEMILADTETGRRDALDRLLPFQQADFEGIFEAMEGLPVTIRLLDPPLHEFLPPGGPGGRRADARPDPLAARVEPDARPARLPPRARVPGDLRDADPRDRPRRARRRGAHRRDAARRDHAPARRLRRGAAPPARADRAVWAEEAPALAHTVGTMIELPRACMRADEIAAHAEFFSFGTNDLTQTTLGALPRRRRGQVPLALPRRTA